MAATFNIATGNTIAELETNVRAFEDLGYEAIGNVSYVNSIGWVQNVFLPT